MPRSGFARARTRPSRDTPAHRVSQTAERRAAASLRTTRSRRDVRRGRRWRRPVDGRRTCVPIRRGAGAGPKTIPSRGTCEGCPSTAGHAPGRLRDGGGGRRRLARGPRSAEVAGAAAASRRGQRDLSHHGNPTAFRSLISSHAFSCFFRMPTYSRFDHTRQSWEFLRRHVPSSYMEGACRVWSFAHIARDLLLSKEAHSLS